MDFAVIFLHAVFSTELHKAAGTGALYPTREPWGEGGGGRGLVRQRAWEPALGGEALQTDRRSQKQARRWRGGIHFQIFGEGKGHL